MFAGLFHGTPTVMKSPLCILFLGTASVVCGATFTVTNTNNSGAGSLRQAVLDANAAAGADTIAFDTAGTFSVARTINLSSRISVTQGLTIDAPGAAGKRLTLNAGGGNAFFQFNTSGATLTVRHITFLSGSGTSAGAIDFAGSPATLTLAVDDCVFNGCVSAAAGGAINAGTGTVTMTDSTVVSCSAATDGGAIKAGTFTGTNCTFSSCVGVNGGALKADTISLTGCAIQSCTASGTGILHYTTLEAGNCAIDGCTATGAATKRILQGDHTTLRRTSLTRSTANGLFPYKSALVATDSILLESCTVSGNSSGVVLSQYARFLNCTVANNGGPLSGCLTREVATAMAGYYRWIVDEILLTMGNSIVSGNGAGVSLSFAYHSLGGNVIGAIDLDAPYYTVPGSGDLYGTTASPVDPLLQPLAAHGGVGDTHLPGTGSPALNHGVVALVATPDYASPFKDGTGGARIQGSGVDAGAVEANQSFVVTNTNDSGAGSLRQAVADAATAAEAVVTFDDTVFASGTAVITLTTPIVLANPVTLSGPDAGVKIRGGNSVGVFQATAASGTVEMQRLWVADGRAASGPGLLATGAARVVMRECYFSGNTATSGAGAVHAQGGFVSATGCLFSGNTAETSGGGGAASAGGKFHATNCTFTSNNAKVNGGAVQAFSNGEVRMVNCTVAGNTADSDANGSGDGGGIGQVGSGVFVVGNCIVASNNDSASGTVDPDLVGTFTSLGHNLISRNNGLVTPGGTPFQNGVNGDIVGTSASPAQPLLGAMAANGGLMQTMKPQTGSPCINNGAAGLLDDTAWPERPDYDARYQFREILAPDMGAVEVGEVSLVKIVAGGGAHTITEFGGEEGSVVLLRSLPTAALDVTVDLAGPATAEPEDFTLEAANLTPVTSTRWTAHFNAGIHQKTLRVKGLDDDQEDPNETVVLSVILGAGYLPVSTAAGERTVTITDEDYVVTNTNGSGPGSFIDKVGTAAFCPYYARVFFDPVAFGPGHHTISIGFDGLTTFRGLIQGPTVEGSSVTIDGSNVATLFLLEDGTDLSIRDLNFTGFDSSVIFAMPINHFPYGVQVDLERCTFHGNHGNGALICSSYARLQARNCTFSGNSATGEGGAISVLADSNRPPMDFPGGLRFEHCTIAFNTSNSDNNQPGSSGGMGGGIYHGSDDYSVFPEAPAIPALFVFRPLILRNCIVAQNKAGSDGSAINNDAAGAILSLGGNQVGASNAAFAGEEAGQTPGTLTPNYGIIPPAYRTTAPIDLFGSSTSVSNPQLVALGWNGGHTRTHALQGASPSIGLAGSNSPLADDQRGLGRTNPEDAGAYEVAYETYAQWQARLFEAGDPDGDRLDDPDGDGLVNQLEWQCGTDPGWPDNPVALQKVGANWRATWSRSLTVDPSVLKLQVSENLTTWSNVSYPASASSSNASAAFFLQTLPAPASNPPRQFMRLRASDP